jgi:aminoglycoside phosphotransferase (APT) family kinase protein
MAESKADNKFEEVVQKFEPQSMLMRTWKLKGGVSAQMTSIEVERPDGCTKKMIVRQHGEVELKHKPHIAADEFKLLRLLHSVGLAAPEPYYLDESGEIFSTPYIVIEYIEGEPILAPKNVADVPTMDNASIVHRDQGDVSRAPGRRWHLPALPTTLARLTLRVQASRKEKRPHTASTQPPSLRDNTFKPPIWVEPVEDFIPQLARQLFRIHGVYCSKLDVSFMPRHAERAAETLGERPEKVDEALDEGRIRDVLEAAWPFHQQNASVLLHGDFWPGNILWRDGQLVGVIDWEDAALGDPLADVANSRLEILWAFGIEAMQSFTHHYQSMTPVDFTNLPYWDLYAALRRIDQIAGWGLDEITEKTMRERLRLFVAQAFLNI